MKISFLGAARTVTGSQHLLTVNGYKVLLDCGLYQGSAHDAKERNAVFDFDPTEIDAVILSHAHIDHCGNLPNLVKQGFTGPIYCTPVTAHLADLLLRDSGGIQESLAEDESKSNPDGEVEEPIYTRAEAAQVKQYMIPTLYDQTFEFLPGLNASLINAGHILGSAAVRLEVEEKGAKKHRIWFSGDIGRQNLPLVRDPVLPVDVDTLIMESTYGDKDHGDPLAVTEALRQVLNRTFERGGRVIIPAFAVGRTQEVVYLMHQLIERGDIPAVPVYVDSPLAAEASQIFMNHPEYFDDEAHNFVRDADSWSALGFDMLQYIESAQESRELNTRREPMVIISTSGMLETGRVLHHVRFSIEDPRNTILIVSYQAPGTLGRALLDGQKQVQIYGRVYECKAEIAMISGLSAHAGQNFLIEYAEAVKGQVKNVFLVHGEDRPAETLQQKLQDKGLKKVYFPLIRQAMEI